MKAPATPEAYVRVVVPPPLDPAHGMRVDRVLRVVRLSDTHRGAVVVHGDVPADREVTLLSREHVWCDAAGAQCARPAWATW